MGTRMRFIEWRYFQWPWVTHNYPKPPPWVQLETSNLVDGLTVASASQWMTNRLWTRRGQVMWVNSIGIGNGAIR